MLQMHRFIPRGRALVAFAGALSGVVLFGAAPALAADAVAPVIDVGALSGTPDGNANWRRTKPATLNLTATDDVAVAKLQYSLDNGVTFVDVPVAEGPSVSAAVPISQEGNTTVRYRAVDTSGNYPAVSQATTLSVAAPAGATGVRLASTTGRIPGDVLVLEPGTANQETVTIQSVVAPNPASPAPNVLLGAPLALGHAAAAPAFLTWRTIAVLIDTFAPVAAWPEIVDGKILQSQTLTPTRTDPRRRDAADLANGSGGTAVRGMWVDGNYVYPFPVALNRLAAGKHSQTVLLQDVAGNAIQYTQTFVVGSSFADLDAVLTQYATNAKTTTLSVGATTLNQPSAAGATGVRLQSTAGRAPGDVLLVDTGANQETATIASIPTPAPPSPNPNVLLTAPLANAHAAGVAVVVATPVGATGIRLGQPVGFRPGDTLLVDTGANQESVTIASVASPVPGGSTPHIVLTAPLTKAHASGVAVSRPEPFIPVGTAGNLRTLLAQAKDAAALGNVVGAVDLLQQFNTAVWTQVVPAGPKAAERAALTTASKAIANELLGGTADTTGTGVTTAPGQSAIRFFWNPTPSTPVPGATYKVLVNGKTGQGGFRHESVVDVEAMIQQLGRDNGFDVDIWDPSTGAGTAPGRAAPAGVSLATSPFADLATLQQYKTIVFDSTVGRNNASGVGATLNPAEFANLQAYIRAGGGFIAIHGATDAYQSDAANTAAVGWYTDLVGATFTNHGSNSAGGIEPDCSTCGVVELQNAAPGHPATALIPDRLPVIDELYNTNRNPVQLGIVNPLVLENEDTLVGQFGYGTGTLMNGDHGMVWCRNFDGGRSFVSTLGHSWELMLAPWYQNMILKGIQTTAGVEYGNCVTFFEVSTLIASDLAAGKITQAGADALNAKLDEVEAARAAGSIQRALNLLDQFVSIAKKTSTGADKAARDELAFKGRELKDWLKTLR